MKAKPATKAETATKPPAKKEKGLGAARLRTLSALKAGKPMTHDAIAKVTGKPKGNKLRELTEEKLVTTSTEKSVLGFVYTITSAGSKALADAK